MAKLSFFPPQSTPSIHHKCVQFCVLSFPFILSLFMYSMFHWFKMFFIYPHKSLCFCLIFIIFISLFFFLGLVNSTIITLIKTKKRKKLKLLLKNKHIQPNEWPHQTKTKTKPKTAPAPNPTQQPEPSGPPQEVTCASPSSTNILVSWRPPPVELQNGIITQYTVHYAATEGEDTTTRQIVNIPPESTQYLLENLEKWTEYRVTVTAHTDVGAGPESLPQVIRTEEDGMCSLKQSSSCNSSLPFLTYPVRY